MGQTDSLPVIHAGTDGPTRAVLKQCPSLHTAYEPPALLRDAYTHVIAAAVLQVFNHTGMSCRRQLVELEDGGTVSLDWWSPKRSRVRKQLKKALQADQRDGTLLPASERPVVLMLHAFSGCSKDGYMRSLAAWSLKEGWIPVSMNMRGCGDLKLTSPKASIPNLTGDVYEAVQAIRVHHPRSPIFGVGFSNGAYTLTKYLADVDSGRLPADGRLAGVLAAHSGYKYDLEMKKIGENKGVLSLDFYERWYWRKYLKAHHKQVQKVKNIDWRGIKRSKTVQELESHFVPPMHGFKDMQAYYDDINAIKLIPRIRTPCMFISSDDDMCLDTSVLPELIEVVGKSPYVGLVMTKYGSHCAHLRKGAMFKPLQSFVDLAAIEFFKCLLTHGPAAAEAEGRGDTVVCEQMVKGMASVLMSNEHAKDAAAAANEEEEPSSPDPLVAALLSPDFGTSSEETEPDSSEASSHQRDSDNAVHHQRDTDGEAAAAAANGQGCAAAPSRRHKLRRDASALEHYGRKLTDSGKEQERDSQRDSLIGTRRVSGVETDVEVEAIASEFVSSRLVSRRPPPLDVTTAA